MRITWEEMKLERGGKGLLEPSEGRKKEEIYNSEKESEKAREIDG